MLTIMYHSDEAPVVLSVYIWLTSKITHGGKELGEVISTEGASLCDCKVLFCSFWTSENTSYFALLYNTNYEKNTVSLLEVKNFIKALQTR